MNKDRKYIHDLEGRIAALEVLVLALVRMQGAHEFKTEYFQEKETAIVGLLANGTVSDDMHDALEEHLKKYEEMLGISSNQALD